MVNMERKCTKCGQLQPTTLFTKDKASKDGITPWCRPCRTAKAMEWKRKNRDKTRANSRRHYHANRDKYLIEMKERYWSEPDARRAYAESRRRSNHASTLLSHARCRAKKFGLAFEIDLEDVIIPTHCPVLGIPLVYNARMSGSDSPSLDRIDNTRGYTKDNIHVISLRANRLKSDATVLEMCKVAHYFATLDTAPKSS